jgi:hypothetical protein
MIHATGIVLMHTAYVSTVPSPSVGPSCVKVVPMPTIPNSKV